MSRQHRPLMSNESTDLDEASQHNDSEVSIESYEKDNIETPNTDLDEDTFGMALCALTRDTHYLSNDWVNKGRCSFPRLGRLLTTLFLLFFTVTLQVLLLHYTQKYVSAKQVHDIRGAYGLFEESMYKCHPQGKDGPLDTNSCFLTPYGNVRGKKAALPDMPTQHARLNELEDGDQGKVCRIPLSQQGFFSLILLIWTLTCFQELRKAGILSVEICKLKTISKMEDCFQFLDEDGDGDHDDTSGEKVIIGLTCCVKIIMLLLQIIRIAITCYLLYIGCRWLLATNNFSDLILNAIALEFILQLKELIYGVLVPARNIVELQMTKITAHDAKMKPGCMEFMGTTLLLALAILWVYLYMNYLQQVLPYYQYDVHDVCTEWIAKRFNISAR